MTFDHLMRPKRQKFQIMKIFNFHLNDHFSHFKQLFDNIHYFLGFPTSNFPNSFYECPFCHDYFLQVHLTRFTPQKHFLKITKKLKPIHLSQLVSQN